MDSNRSCISSIGGHIKYIFDRGELEAHSVSKKSLPTAVEGNELSQEVTVKDYLTVQIDGNPKIHRERRF